MAGGGADELMEGAGELVEGSGELVEGSGELMQGCRRACSVDRSRISKCKGVFCKMVNSSKKFSPV
jgi:X-X-X-Leu-X-X-Gly heptad repeat protein